MPRQADMVKRYSSSASRLVFVALSLFCVRALAFSNQPPLPDEVLSAKSIYIVNETGNQNVLNAAYNRFAKWGRFTVAPSKDDADLVIVFTHKNGMDAWGNAGLILMDVFPKGSNHSAFEVKKGFRTITEPQLRTLRCIDEFAKRLEQKH